MKRVKMLRERIYKSKEFEIDPNEPDIILSKGLDGKPAEVFGNEDDDGYWNEYYRVGVVDTDDDYTDQDDDFQGNAEDFYSLKEAQERYSELAKEIKIEQAEEEIKSYEDAGMTPPEELLRERYC